MGLLGKAAKLRSAYTYVIQASDRGHTERIRDFEVFKPSDLAVLSVRIPPSMKRQLSEYFTVRGLTLSDGVRYVLGDFIAKNIEE